MKRFHILALLGLAQGCESPPRNFANADPIAGDAHVTFAVSALSGALSGTDTPSGTGALLMSGTLASGEPAVPASGETSVPTAESSASADPLDAGVDVDSVPPQGSDAPPDSSEVATATAPGTTTPTCEEQPELCVDCDALEAACVTDSEFLRSLTANSGVCEFECVETPRPCSFTTDSYCPLMCRHTNDIDCERPNRLFVTRTAYDGNMGGLPGADAKCQTSANAAGLSGTFIALLGTSTTRALDRLGQARGFIRVDDAPLADQSDELVSGQLLNAPNVNEYLELMPIDTNVATGFDRLDQADYTCQDWSVDGIQGDFGNAGYAGYPSHGVGNGPCDVRLHLYCVENSKQVEVRPVRIAGTRKAFLASGYDPTSGLAGADATCSGAAEAASISGNFKAFLASGGQAASTRFDLSGAPWARLDGTPIVAAAADLAEARLSSALNQTSTGAYVSDARAWTGMNDPNAPPLETCQGWTSAGVSVTGHMGNVTSTGSTFLSSFSSSAFPCAGIGGYLYCLEEEGAGTAPTLPQGRANTLFVTSQSFTGDLGGLAGADQKCSAEASAAGLSGTFVALIGTASQNLQQRLGSARGFVRPDNLPVAASPVDWFEGRILYPPSVDAEGGEQEVSVWTGAQGDCQGWTSAASYPVTGSTGGAHLGGYSALYTGANGCDQPQHLYCAEVSQRVALPSVSASGYRLAFMARGSIESWTYAVDPGVGLSGLDAQCELEATWAGLNGNFRAFVATSTASAVSRFNPLGAAYARPDGVELAPSAQAFFDAGPEYAINVTADGFEYFSNYAVWFGASSPHVLGTQTCNDWTSRSASFEGSYATASVPGLVSAFSNATCDGQYLHLICLQL